MLCTRWLAVFALTSVLLGASCSSSEAPPPDVSTDAGADAGEPGPGPGPGCGNGALDPGEECDDGNPVSGDGCQPNCRFSCHAPADCDDKDACTADTCAATGSGWACSHTVTAGLACADGNPCSGPDACNELGQCVPGPNNCDCETAADCASREDGDLCNGTLTCVDRHCVVHPATVVVCDASQDSPCRRSRCAPSTGVCSLVNEPDDTACDDGLFCTTRDTCHAGACVGSAATCAGLGCANGCDEAQARCLPASAGTLCRAAAGTCDVAESCDGASAACPGDQKKQAGTVCRPSEGDCDLVETCNGLSASCPDDAVQIAETPCRPADGPCDVAEACDGSGKSCPVDGVADSSVVCRPSAGPCDLPEQCDGSTKGCSVDLFADASVVCRPSAGTCDVAERCTGASPACPDDTVLTSNVVCRPVDGPCDLAESCDGTHPACPDNRFAGRSRTCRDGAGPCDVPETCTGLAAACPGDVKMPPGTECRIAADACDVPETCNGSGDGCPTDTWASSGTPCRPSAGECDVTDLCTGLSAECPLDERRPQGTVCRNAQDACDAAEACDGVAATCPPDAFTARDTVCRHAAGVCDVTERCTGLAAACPTDAFQEIGSACNDGDACTVDDACNGLGACSLRNPLPPRAPAPLWPPSGWLTGSSHAAPERFVLRPQLRWRAPSDDGCGNLTYDVEVDDSCAQTTFSACAFATPEASMSLITDVAWRPEADLPVSTVTPVGRRYYWRVRACRSGVCSPWSGIRYFDAGRVANDFDGDGYSDLAIGAPEKDGQGAVLIYRGDTGTGSTTAIRELLPPTTGAGQRFGAVLATGDLDADGYADLVVAAPSLPGALGADEGAVYLYLGGPDGIAATPDQVLFSPEPQVGALFGTGLAGDGDVDGDGYSDLVVGAPYQDDTATHTGIAFVFRGTASGVGTSAPWRIANPTGDENAHFGIGVAAGDLTGDGFADLAFGNADPENPPRGFGRVNVLLGSATGLLPQTPNNVIGGLSTGVTQGSIALDGDDDGDGWLNLAVGMRSWCCYASAIYTYNGSPSGIVGQAGWGKGTYYPEEFGYGLGNGGDFNGDGRFEVVSGTPSGTYWDSRGFVEIGLAGPTTLDYVLGLGNPAGVYGGRFGEAVATRGDLNGDGYSDLVVSAPQQGSVYLYLGRSTGLATVPDREIVGTGKFGRGLPR